MASVKLILYKQKTLKDGRHPIMLRIIENRKATRISIGYNASIEEWNEPRCCFTRKANDYKNRNTILKELEIKAEKVLNQIRLEKLDYTPTLFKDLFIGIKKEITVFEFFETLIDEMKAKEQFSNASVYRTTLNSLHKFRKKIKSLKFADIDYTFLKKYETHLFKGGCSGGGVHNYMRTVRAVINEAIRRGYLPKEKYPFSTQFNKSGYSLSHLKSTASPRALSLVDMEKFKNFDVEKHPEFKTSWLMFLFSYYARGINFTDMAHLKWSDIYNNRITYTRQKTGKFFTIGINENLQKILDEFEPKITDYVFPVLTDFHKTTSQKKNRIIKKLKQFNSDLKEMGKILELPIKLTSYVARHTFATTLKAKDVSVAKISQSMGHADIATTQAYLKQFEDREIDALDELL